MARQKISAKLDIEQRSVKVIGRLFPIHSTPNVDREINICPRQTEEKFLTEVLAGEVVRLHRAASDLPDVLFRPICIILLQNKSSKFRV